MDFKTPLRNAPNGFFNSLFLAKNSGGFGSIKAEACLDNQTWDLKNL